MVRKSGPSRPRKQPRKTVGATNGLQPFSEDEIDFSAWLRVQRSGGKLPQGVSPDEKRKAIEALADINGVMKVQDPRAMVADFWPADETADDIAAAIRELRGQG